MVSQCVGWSITLPQNRAPLDVLFSFLNNRHAIFYCNSFKVLKIFVADKLCRRVFLTFWPAWWRRDIHFLESPRYPVDTCILCRSSKFILDPLLKWEVDHLEALTKEQSLLGGSSSYHRPQFLVDALNLDKILFSRWSRPSKMSYHHEDFNVGKIISWSLPVVPLTPAPVSYL